MENLRVIFEGVEYIEEWKYIKGYESYYQISSFGRVKSLKRKCRHNYGGFRTVNERILSSCGPSGRYLSVVLCGIKANRTITIHKLVATHFVENKENKPEVNHKDGIKWNNFYLNLEWSTRSENETHAYVNGLAKTHSQNHHSAKLSNSQVLEIRRKLKTGVKGVALSLEYSVSQSTISVIKRNAKWKHIK